MVFKNLLVIFFVVICFISCKKEKVPAGIIEKEKMISVLIDMQIVDSYLNQVTNVDTMLMQANSRYTYLFNKHAIDSAKFTNSLKYYSLRSVELDKMYKTVIDSLEMFQKKLREKPKKVKKSK